MQQGDAPHADDYADDRTERKRMREKKRREDLAEAFGELAQLVSRVHPSEEADATPTRKRSRRRSRDHADVESGDAPGLPRLELIARTIEAIRHLHQENVGLKHKLAEQQLGDSSDPNKVSRYSNTYQSRGTCPKIG